MQGIVIAGTHSGCGKTTITLGILAALRKRGLTVQPFKAGPDFIDTGLHKMIVDRTSRNLDLWMCGEAYVAECFTRHSAEADIAVVEGVMGMYDGEFSTARLAEVLGLPVILIVDAYGMAESAGAVVKGFLEFRVKRKELREINSRFKIQDSKFLSPGSGPAFAGVIFNRVGSERHYTRLRDSIHDVPVLGYLPSDISFSIPHRHLGLVVADEAPIAAAEIDKLAEAVLEHIDIDLIVRKGRGAEVRKGNKTITNSIHLSSGLADFRTSTLRIAVPCDKAFCFYYEDNLDMLREAGAEIITFSPLLDHELPERIDALCLGGGYPELYARELSANRNMIDSIRRFSEEGNPVYAECGGFMYLTEGIYDLDGNFSPMAGVFPFSTVMKKGRASLGYRQIELNNDCILGGKGEVMRGHEFHYSELVTSGQRSAVSNQRTGITYAVKDGEGNAISNEGYRIGSTLGSYIHLHFGSNNEAVKNIIYFIKEHYGMYSAGRSRQSQKGRQQS